MALHVRRCLNHETGMHQGTVNYDEANFSRKVILRGSFHETIVTNCEVHPVRQDESVSALATSCANNLDVYPGKGYNQFFEEDSAFPRSGVPLTIGSREIKRVEGLRKTYGRAISTYADPRHDRVCTVHPVGSFCW